jgi:hypothetical protein
MKFQRKSPGSILLPVREDARLAGHLHIVHRRPVKGWDKWRILDEEDCHNLIVNQGLNHLLGVELAGVTQIANWFMGIFQGNYAPSLTDTAANWAANATECSSYTSATRPAWQQGGAASQSITNSANPAVFTFNADVTVYGAALVSSSTIAGTSGTLFSEAAFGTPKTVVAADQLLVTYTVGASG